MGCGWQEVPGCIHILLASRQTDDVGSRRRCPPAWQVTVAPRVEGHCLILQSGHGIEPGIRVLELFGRYGRRFYFDQATIGSTRILTLLHGLGRKWSLFYEGLLETMLSESLEGEGMLETMLSKSLEGDVKRFSLTSTDNQVVAEISMDPLKNLQPPADDIFKRIRIPLGRRERRTYKSSDLSPIA